MVPVRISRASGGIPEANGACSCRTSRIRRGPFRRPGSRVRRDTSRFPAGRSLLADPGRRVRTPQPRCVELHPRCARLRPHQLGGGPMRTIFAALCAMLALAPAAARAKDTVRIAFVGPLTGGNSAIGLGGRNSADLAVKLRNQEAKA